MRRLLTPRWILVHLGVVSLVVACALLCRWQVERAAAGNLLSFGYAVQWPVFAVFVIYVWVKEMRQAQRREPTSSAQPPRQAPAAQPPIRRNQAARARSEAAYDDSDDEQLAAYNRYLAWLNQNPHASPAEFPG